MLKDRLGKFIAGYLCYGAELYEWDYAREKDRLHNVEMRDLFQNGKYDEIAEKLAKWVKISEEEKKQIIKTLRTQKDGKKSDFEVNYKLLKELFESKNQDDLSLGRWLMLKTYANIFGWYTLSLICIDKAKKRVYDHPKKLNYWRLRLLACIEDGREEEAKKCYRYISSRPWLTWDFAWPMVEQLYGISIGDDQLLEGGIEKFESQKKEYYRYINDHDIWIIGPSPEKTDEHCLAKEGVARIRFNYKGESWAKAANISVNTDISYCRKTFCENYLKENVNISEYMNTEYIMLPPNSKKKVDTVLENKAIEYEPTNWRITFEGAHNFLQTVIMDVCKYGKKEIKVVGTNLFLGKLHAKGYDYGNGNGANDYDSVRVNNILCTPTANFSILKLFYKWGVIKPVGELKQVLDMELKEYLAAMEEKYTLSMMQ